MIGLLYAIPSRHQPRQGFSVHKGEEPTIIVGKSDATMQPASQNNQLMPKHRVLSSNRICVGSLQ
jgi:hypothetical protein